MREKLNLTESELKIMYYEEGLSQKEIAERLGCSLASINRYMRNIPKRGYSDRQKARKTPVEAVGTPVENRVETPVKVPAKIAVPVEAPAMPTVRTAEAVNTRGLDIVSHTLTVRGASCLYEIDLTEKVVTLKDGERKADVTGILDAQGCYDLCKELMKVYSIMEAGA